MLVDQSATQGVFSDSAKIASVSPVFKKEDPLDKGNYRRINISIVFSKVFKKYYSSHLQSFFDKVNFNKVNLLESSATRSSLSSSLNLSFRILS